MWIYVSHFYHYLVKNIWPRYGCTVVRVDTFNHGPEQHLAIFPWWSDTYNLQIASAFIEFFFNFCKHFIYITCTIIYTIYCVHTEKALLSSSYKYCHFARKLVSLSSTSVKYSSNLIWKNVEFFTSFKCRNLPSIQLFLGWPKHFLCVFYFETSSIQPLEPHFHIGVIIGRSIKVWTTVQHNCYIKYI